MRLRIPRKLKKELCKIDCIEQTASYVTPSFWRVKLKAGIRTNKWTNILVCKMYQERKKTVECMFKESRIWIK